MKTLRCVPLLMVLFTGSLVACSNSTTSSASNSTTQSASDSATSSASESVTPPPSDGTKPADWMVYQRETMVMLIRTDGTGRSSPTKDVIGEQTNPDWSPDGKRIVFALTNEGTDDLWTVGADGVGAAQLLDCVKPCLYFDDPAWSPDGTQVMYEKTAEVNGKRLATMESVAVADGKVTKWLTADPNDFYSGVRYSPDGKRVVFEEVHAAGPEVASEITGVTLTVMDLSDPAGTMKGITDPALFAATADWSPDGSNIVYSALPKAGARTPDLFSIAPDGSGLTRITTLADEGGSAEEPAWSVDGSTVYFVANKSAQAGIGTVPAAGGTVKPAFGDTFLEGRHPRLHAG